MRGTAVQQLRARRGLTEGAVLIGTTILGAVLGMWVSSMVGSAIPNSRLQQFEAAIEQGGILLMIDVPRA